MYICEGKYDHVWPNLQRPCGHIVTILSYVPYSHICTSVRGSTTMFDPIFRDPVDLLWKLQADTMACKATITSSFCLEKGLKCWESWEITCRHKAKDITTSTAKRSKAYKENETKKTPPSPNNNNKKTTQQMMIYLKRKTGHYESDKNWNCFKL